jgi:hypothetical protein
MLTDCGNRVAGPVETIRRVVNRDMNREGQKQREGGQLRGARRGQTRLHLVSMLWWYRT